VTPYIVFCESNLKGGVRAALGQRTLVVGPTGSGKSALVNTVELALTGRVSDMVGRREVAKEVELMTLAPERKGVLLARVLFDNGAEATWKAGGKGGKKAKHAVPAFVDPTLALPLRPVYDAIVGSVETARKFFIQFAVGAISDADVLKRISVPLHPYYKRATMQETLSTSTAVDRLLAALERAKKGAREARDRAKAAESTATETAQGLPPLPTEAEEKALKDALKGAQKTLDKVKAAIAGHEALAGAAERVQAAAVHVEQAKAAEADALRTKSAAEVALSTLPVPQTLDPSVMAVVEAIRSHAHSARSDCLVCGSAGPFDHTGRLAKLDSYLTSVETNSTSYRTASTSATLAAAAAANATRERERAEEALATLRGAASAGNGAIPTSEQVAAAEAEVTRLNDAWRRIDVLKATWASSQKARESAAEAQKEEGDWKKLSDECIAAVTSLLDGAVNGFAARVQKRLPGTDAFNLTLRDGERGVFQFGLVKSGTLYTALSGGEWARVTAAMAACCRPPPDKYALVIPEDRGMDPATLSAVLAAFGNIEDAQVLVATTTMPATLPAGWTLIDTTRGDHKSAEPPALAAGASAVPPIAEPARPEPEVEPEPLPSVIPLFA
jgi:energy-coupling factor transporter ATP-binding protein EcfA2